MGVGEGSREMGQRARGARARRRGSEERRRTHHVLRCNKQHIHMQSVDVEAKAMNFMPASKNTFKSRASMCSCWLFLFDDKRLLSGLLAIWTLVSSIVFVAIMVQDGSDFLTCGPNPRNRLFGVVLDSWSKWWAVALYTFFSTCIAAFSSDAIWPFLTNVVMDPKTKYIPYSKATCLTIIQIQTIYGKVTSDTCTLCT